MADFIPLPLVEPTSRLAELSRENLAWLGGLLEGEGTFSQVNGRYLGVKVEMTDEDVVRRCYELTGVGRLSLWRGRTENHKAVFAWRVQDSATAYAVMVAVWPWLGQRRHQKIVDVIKVWLSFPRAMPAHIHRVGRARTAVG